jgi:uncharacterized protein YkwD
MILSARSLAIASASLAVAFAVLAYSAPNADARCRGERSVNKTVAAGAMLCLVNQQRARRGIPALRIDSRLSRVAGRHARHMVKYSFTGHKSPVSGGLVKRVQHAHVFSSSRAFSVGENLGWGGSALAINRAWMRSAIHKKATLYRAFTKVGIGVVRGLPHGSKRRSLTYVVTFAG